MANGHTRYCGVVRVPLVEKIAVSDASFLASAAKKMRTELFLSYDATSSGNFLPTFRDTLSVPLQGHGTETSVRNYH